MMASCCGRGGGAIRARHLPNWWAGIWGGCMRRAGGWWGMRHLAEDVSQAVFVLLAQKAGELEEHAVLAGWLYRTAMYAAANARRRAADRRRHERGGGAGGSGRGQDAGGSGVGGALGTLRAADREAILLRYHQGMSLAEVRRRRGPARMGLGSGWIGPWGGCVGRWPGRWRCRRLRRS